MLRHLLILLVLQGAHTPVKSIPQAQVVVKAFWMNDNGTRDSFPTKENDSIINLAALDEDLVIEWTTTIVDSTAIYKYNLKNLNTHWIQSNIAKAQYTNLSGGDYIFQIHTVVNGKSVPLHHIPIHVEKRITEEWWFWLVIFVCVVLPFLAIIYLLSMLNLRQKLNVQVVRNRIASDLHDDVGASLNGIRLLAELLQERLSRLKPRSQEILSKIIADAREAGENLDDTVWAVRPTNDSVQEMTEKIQSFAYSTLAACNIPLDFKNEIQPHEVVKITNEQRRNTYLMCKEAINNMAKHSQATQARIHIKRDKGGLYLSVEDNGKGFDDTIIYEGDGLKNFQARAAACFIQFSIKAKPGEGVHISIFIPDVNG